MVAPRNRQFGDTTPTMKHLLSLSKRLSIRYLSLRTKLSLTFIVLMSFAFLIATILSVQTARAALINALKDGLATEASLKAESIRSYLIWTRGMATDLAAAAEANALNDKNILNTIENTLARNEHIYGSTNAYEPYKFMPDLYYWSPYYSRSSNGEINFTQLGNPEYDYFQWDWYTIPKSKNAPVLSPPYYDEGGGEIWMVTWSVPFYDKDGQFEGVATADIAFSQTQEIVRQIAVGRNGYAFLIDNKGTVLGIGDKGGKYQVMVDTMQIVSPSQQQTAWNNTIQAMIDGKLGFVNVLDPQGQSVFIAYEPVGLDTGWSLGLAYPETEVLQPAYQLQNTLIALEALIAVACIIALFFFTQSIANPIQQLASHAKLFTSEHLDWLTTRRTEPIRINTHDELEDLGDAFNQMTSELARSFGSLEQRVVERTSDLEAAKQQSDKRVRELQTINEISNIINSEQKHEILFPLITRLVSEQFGFYHVGIYLLDSTRKFAVLKAASSEGGHRMLARGFKLEVGETGIIGYVTKHGVHRIALDVGSDSVFFNNPDLPETRSEMTLPLVIRGEIIGALDVQSIAPAAFTEYDAATMRVLADQIAIAIENARLFEQTQNALQEMQALYRQYLQEEWSSFMPTEEQVGYQQDVLGGKKIFQPIETNDIRQAMNRGDTVVTAPKEDKAAKIVVPVKLRGQVIGVLNVTAPATNMEWNRDEINLVEAVAERLALALENARLLQESQSRAAKERLISEVTTKVGSSINMNNVLQSAVEELGRVLPGSEVIIQLGSENGASDNSNGRKG